MKKIIIVGAGGFGRELLWWIKDINAQKPTWEIAGFLDDNPDALKNCKCDVGVIGSVRDWQPSPDEVFALAIAAPAVKRKVVARLKSKGAVFTSVIHPTAKVSEFSKYGEGIVMFPYSKLSCDSVAGDFVTVLSTAIGHDTSIGDYTTVSGGCNIVRNVNIGKDVFIAAGVCIAQDINIGDNTFIGLGSVVVKDVKTGSTVFGNPARPMPLG